MSEHSQSNQSGILSQQPSLTPSEAVYDYFVRIASLDDVDPIHKQIPPEEAQKLNLLFAYPNLLRLFERSFISVTILDRNHNIIGAACFNDSPPGLQGKYDHLHQNLWEGWLTQAYNTEKIDITSYNTLWMTYMFVNEENKGDYQMIMERVFQNIYSFRPEMNGILFLQRAEVGSREGECDVLSAVRNLFLKFKKTKPEVLKQVIGVSVQSEIFYSTKLQVTETMEIRMAKEEDHDDLAEIFNSQSEVLTSQFGEFFIADLIATQNLTRRMTKGSKSQGKAIVGQVGQKAVGLMSISTQIDYQLLNNCFELGLYDSLIKNDLMEAISKKRARIQQERDWEKEDQMRIKKTLVEQEFVKCTKIGQRVLLQQYCIDKQLDIRRDMETLGADEQAVRNLNKDGFIDIVNKWMQDHCLYFPSERLLEFPEELRKLETFIVTPTEFLLETLEIFGLPKNYIHGNGHWKDWAKKIMQEKRTRQLRRPARKVAPRTQNARKGKQSKEDDQKPPSYFDMTPFKEAFSKFISVGSEIRTILREEVIDKKKKMIMHFCDKDGEMIKTNSVDLGGLAKTMGELGFEISLSVLENLYSILEAFGGIKYDESVVQMVAKQEQDPKKKMFLVKKADNEAPKMVDVTLRMTNYRQFHEALNTIEYFDTRLARLGYLKSQRLQAQVKLIVEAEKLQTDAINAERSVLPDYGQYESFVSELVSDEFPEIPYQCQNAIVVNLFCMDEVYEARSLEFVEYAFNLFPDRDYMILTQPFSIQESILLQNFMQVEKKKNSTFEHCLYIYHRDTLLCSGLQIRRSKPQDIPRASYLLDTMLHSDRIKSDIIDSLNSSSSKLIPFTVTCGEEIIGMYVVSKAVNLDYYVSHFFVRDHLIIKQHPKQCHTKLIHAILNPLFQKSVRFILREILRLLNKTCMYFQVHERTLLPDIFHQFVLVRSRVFPHFLRRKWDVEVGEEEVERRLKIKGAVDNERDPFDETEPPFSLSIITKKQLHAYKVSNNSRIVVVGASDTGISFIESLLSIREINFTNITLLAPGGLLTMHVKNQKQLLKVMSTSYNLEELKNLMIDARTTVLDAKMVKLDKKNKRIMLDTGACVPFDILVIAVGLIDTQLQNQGLISCGLSRSQYYKDKKYIQGVYSIDDPYLYKEFEIESKNVRLLKRKKKPANITIYGRTPHTISFITGLIERGVDPKRIYFVTPNPTRPRKRNFGSNAERLAYEESLVNDPDSFEDAKVEQIVIEQLITLGVNVSLGFQYHEMNGNPCQSVRFRKKAPDYDLLQEQIKLKRIEIQQKLQEAGNRMQDDYQSDDSDAEEKISPQQEIEILEQKQYIQLQTPCSFFITSGLIDIDREIFNIIHENGLVYNGRLIVKSNFQTTESEIFACGKICQFSQRYKNYSIGKSLRLDKYNGRELGAILSKHVLQKLDLSYLTTEKYNEENLPKLYMPLGCGGALPGKLVYYFIRKNDYSQPKLVYEKEKQKGEQYREIMSNNIKTDTFEGHYIRFMIDNNGLIDSVSYLGSEDVVIQSLMSFVGLSVNYLNKLTSRYKHGLISDISQFLSENWAICIYHELFSELRHNVKSELLNHPVADRIMNRASEKSKQGENVSDSFFKDIKAIIPEDLINLVRQGTVSFIQQNTNHLPMYYLPKSKVKNI